MSCGQLEAGVVGPANQPKMDGYDKLAHLMGQHEELMLMPRFSYLTAKDLLYRQAELVHLEAELEEIGLEDHSKAGTPTNFQYSLFDLKRSLQAGEESIQWRKVLEIREKIADYR